MNERKSPAGEGEALKDSAGQQNSYSDYTPGPKVSPGVLEITVSNPLTARKTIASATADAEPGTFVRLHVGHTLPPLWLAAVIRTDLVWQVVARDAKALGSWQFELEFGGGR